MLLMGSRIFFAALLATAIAFVAGDESHLLEFRCYLRSSGKADCDLKDSYVPERLLEIYNNLSSNARAQLSAGNPEGLTFEEVADLPPALIYLLPADFLEKTSGLGLATLMQRHSNDSALAFKIVSALVNPAQRNQFFDKLIGTSLPAETQHLLGKAMFLWWPDLARDWTFDTFQNASRNGSPLLAFIPPGAIAPLKDKLAVKFLYHLRSWHRSTLRLWAANPKVVQRIWAFLALRGPYAEWQPEDLKGFEFLLNGATTNELNQLISRKIDVQTIISSKLDKLQARALFRVMFGAETLSTAELKKFMPLSLQLSPRELLQFSPNSTDFRLLRLVTPDRRTSSFAADKQILESLKAQSALAYQDESENANAWRVGIRDLGRFVHVMPARELRVQSASGLGALAYHAIDSDKISREQALALTNAGGAMNLQRPASVLGLRGLLKALSTSRIVAYHVGDLPQNVLGHLANNLPLSSPALSAAVLHKLRPQLGQTKILEHLLSNKHPEQFFDLIPPIELKSLVKEILSSFKILQEEGFALNIKKLPQRTLSTLLDESKTKSGCWDPEELKEHVAFLGLSCHSMDEVDVVDTIDVLERYHRDLHEAGKSFPKTLQYCGQLMVMRYISLKSFLRHISDEKVRLDVLDPAEIRAIGGYILASLPPQTVKASAHRTEILLTIGQLPLPQLLEATGRGDHLIRFTNYLMSDLIGTRMTLGIDELLSLGSLMNCVSIPDKVFDPAAFKFVVEALEDPRSKTICANFDTRKRWYTLIEGAFGTPDKWTAGDLGSLGDFLLAVPSEALDLVPAKRWTEAVDSLIEQTSYHLEITWPGWDAPIPFVQACSELLTPTDVEEYRSAVRQLLHRYLIASQAQLDTVESAEYLIDAFKYHEEVIRVVHGMHVDREPAKVEVSVPTELPSTSTTPSSIRNETASTKLLNTTTEDTTLEAVTQNPNLEMCSGLTCPVTTTTPSGDADVCAGLTCPMTTVPTTASEESTETESQKVEISSETAMEPTTTTTACTTTPTTTTPTTTTATSTTPTATTPTTTTPTTTTPTTTTPTSTTSTTTTHDVGVEGVEKATTPFKVTQVETQVEMQMEKPPIGTFTESDWESHLSIEHHQNETALTNSSDFIHSQTVHRSKRDEEFEDGEKVEIFVNMRAQSDNATKMNKKSAKISKKTSVKIDNDNRTQKKLSCDALRALGPSAALALQWRDLELMAVVELENCLEFLGSFNMSHDIYMKIWDRIDREVLLSNLASLGHLTQAFQVRDVQSLDLNLTSPRALDQLTVISRHVRHYRVLEALAQRVMQQNEDASEVGPAALTALGRIVCDLPVFTLRRLAGRDLALAAPALGSAIAGCPAGCLDSLARLVSEDDAFGDPVSWSSQDLEALGKIPAGLLAQQWASVNASAMSGVDASAIRCIPPLVFKELSKYHLLNLSPVAASLVTNEQLSLLSADQKSALLLVRSLTPIPVRLPFLEGRQQSSSSAGVVLHGARRSRSQGVSYLRYVLAAFLSMMFAKCVVF